MFNLFTATNGNVSALNYSELVELVRDCRITCSAALHTLNDLLLFDKIENNMLKLEIKQTNIKSFLEECLQPFVRQVRKTREKHPFTLRKITEMSSFFLVESRWN
jgi:signal transduction histidine kinase